MNHRSIAASTLSEGLLPPPPPLRLEGTALFADLDGTLTPLAPTPQAVGPDADRRRRLEILGRALGGRLAVVSGRSLADLDRVLEGQVRALAGVHGLERRDATGRLHRPAAPPGIAVVLAGLRRLAEARPGLLVEDKGAAAALHYRLAPEAREACRTLARRLAGEVGLVVQEGDMVVEMRMAGADKGSAVRAFMAEAPFAGHQPVYVGDDLTDEDGFAAAQDLGGLGVIVGPRRPTRARCALADVAAVGAWLDRALAMAGQP